MSVEEIITTIAGLPEAERRRVWAELDELRSSDPVAPEPKRPSAHDLAKHLIGGGTGRGSGRRDVSSNKGYLRGFGEGSLS